ncbi:non-ribosomal peptide synthetase [Chamaesiphon minutus]|uniref:Amino acid adenylation enzyme/thioester reductase family protein n=1 Tax=Chamaesiphon minutus (strain ATCC 27169 / PCC 6605) TaxID=1173020 RepID=K9UEW8_CHAP6|nr:non-ribosomal peptide synthetase [Chamaesiphon minutus]AFY93667.1 amino acid adenylation enzyme/thioester reductase family protein [Chamaesiphon minutus PCC 6605]
MTNDLSKRIAALSPEQQALLKQRLSQQKTSQPTQVWAIPKRDKTTGQDRFAVSFGQQRMWFQDQLGTQSAVSNNVSISLKISGNLDVNALERSLVEILDRHEVLRTNFQTIAGELIQIIHPVGNWYVPFIDLRSLDPLERDREIERIAQAQACQIFNLATDVLLRSSLLICAPTEHILLLTLHHISVDAWSIGVFFRELSAIYAAFASGKPSPLSALPVQYADFAIWQRQYLQGQMLAEDLAYWQQKLHQAPDLLPLPSDRSRPSVQSFTGKTLSFTIPKPLTKSISALSQQTGCTTFVTLLAALQTLLFRYSGQEDILVGAPIANRQQPELENLIGCFINTLVFRSDLSGNPSFRILLDRVRETVLGSLAHQTLPFEKLVEELQLARNLTYAPLFQVMLVFQNAFSIENIELPNLAVEHDRIDNHTSQFDFTIHLVESEIGLIGKLEYNTDLFDESTIERLLAHFQTLLAGIVANPDCCLAELPLLAPSELQQLQSWNQSAVNDLPIIGIDRAFAAQVSRTPDALAVICGDEQLTYRELDRRTNQLAHYLQNLGVKADSLVGICVDRSIETIVGLWGIIKAGGAYVPIDPNYPAERLEFILADAQVSVLLTKKSLLQRLKPLLVLQSTRRRTNNFDAPVVLLDGDWERINLESDADLAVSPPIERLAYIIYTSGSTGQPKGVMVQHDSLANYTAAAIEEYTISDRDRVLQFASLSFDAAAEEIFPCLTCGATLVLRTEAMLSSIEIFLHTCDEWQITVLDLPTAFWHQMVTEMSTQKLSLPDSVRLVILGGEKAARDRFITWQKLVKPHVRLVNSYGPTEATIVTTTIDLSALTEAQLTGRELPIGTPVTNASTYILDSSLQPTPSGIPGELYIGGAGVARGYLNRPDLTALAFIPDPFKPNARLYKTGDRVRYWADGNIEFLGRIDRQVKIRGFRIELGEIEALLTQHPQVRESLVIDRPDANGDIEIVAYIVPESDSELTIRSLRRLLETRLPKYMMPAGFVLLAAFPLNGNGKIDRQMLPAPELDRSDLDNVFIAPRTPIETEIARIFGEVLNLVGGSGAFAPAIASMQENRVGVDDDFFELGGHSLLATKLIARLLSSFEVPLSIVDLFQSPTVAGLAERIDRLSIDRKSSLRPIERTFSVSAPLSFSQESIWAWHHAGSKSSALNSSIVLRITGDLNRAVVERSFNEIVRRHEILRTVFREIDERPIQSILPTLHLPLGYQDLQPLPPDERELAAFNLAIDLATPEFDLAVAPLLRTNLLQLAPQEHWLLLTMHHIITDGSSFSLLIDELHQLIQAYERGLPSPLSLVPLQYADFVAWQQQPEHQVEIDRQLAYWSQKLVDGNGNADSTVSTKTLTSQSKYGFTAFPDALAEAIAALSQTLGVTSFAILSTGLQLALAAESGREEIAIVTTIGNRTVPQTETMLGCFINETILKSQLCPDLTGKMLLDRLQLDIYEAIAHKDVPFESVLSQIERHAPIDLMASLTVTNSTQGLAAIPNWELVVMQTRTQQWDDISAELDDIGTPLEFYIEMSKPMRVMVNYGIERYTEESIDRLLASYESILRKLITAPAATVAHLLEEART